MTSSSALSGLIAFIVTPTQAKAWAKFSRPFGPKLTPKSERRPRLQSFLRASRLPRWERYRDWAYFVFSHLLFVIISWLS
jgi:hypothetical protein